MGECCIAKCKYQVQWIDANLGPKGTLNFSFVPTYAEVSNGSLLLPHYTVLSYEEHVYKKQKAEIRQTLKNFQEA